MHKVSGRGRIILSAAAYSGLENSISEQNMIAAFVEKCWTVPTDIVLPSEVLLLQVCLKRRYKIYIKFINRK